MQDIQTVLPTGSVIKDRYIVEDLLGKGGFGAVYLVRDQRVRGNLFALKEVIDPNKEERERFAFECEVLKRLDHPALTRVYRVFEDNKNIRVYMLMDYIQGPNLEILRQRQADKHFSTLHVLKIMAPIVDAVSYLHRQRPPIIHRDIKPANIIVPDEGDETVLVDFGIAKEYDQDSTTTAVRRCSPGYGAPEQYARGTDPRTDIYGLGATFYSLLTGVVPSDALYRMTQLGSKHTDPLEPIQQFAPDVPSHVATAITRAMSIDKAERFATVDEFWQALHAYPIAEPRVAVVPVALPQQAPVTMMVPNSDGSTVSTTPTVVNRQVQEKPRRRRGIIPILLVLLALVALIAGIAFGTGLFSKIGDLGRVASTIAPKAKNTPVHGVPTPTSTANPSSTPATTTTPQPSPSSSSYPALNSQYTGQIVDQIGPTTTSMSLTGVTQNGANIKGQFIVGPALQGSNPFTGTVSTNNTIQFQVQAYANHLPLRFNGAIQRDGSMTGTYCSVGANGQCDNSQGHGTWNVKPPSPGSYLSLPGVSLVISINEERRSRQ